MKCPEIKYLNLDARSRGVIAEIKRINKMSSLLSNVMAGGVFVNIFAGNGVLKSAYSIQSTDWRTWAQAMAAIPAIQRRRISDIARQEALDRISGDQKTFWGAVADGCRY